MVKHPPHHDSDWHMLHDGTDVACINGHEFIEGNYEWREDADGKYKWCLYCQQFLLSGQPPVRELPEVAQQSYSRKSHLKRRRGIRQQQYDTLLARQNGLCAVCGAAPTPEATLSVDNPAGTILGLLCRRCCTLVAMSKRDVPTVHKLAAYLNRTNQYNTVPQIIEAVVVPASPTT
jgi:hypothetical protein